MKHVKDIREVATKTTRSELHWIGGKKRELPVYQIDIAHLYFNIKNGRYADRMLRLQRDNPGVVIDPKLDDWKERIEKMLAGEHEETARDKTAFAKLLEDINEREQLKPGVVTVDGGVIDGNRRLAALRRLNVKNRGKFRSFDCVILPADTTDEDRWRIEAGLQLGVNERWNYSPINELLKIRDGVKMYEDMRRERRLPGAKSPELLVAEAIYGKTETQIREMVARLQLIDEYLDFVKQPGAYDTVGTRSERFLEAGRIVRAAENNSVAPSYMAKLKAMLFYLIDLEEIESWDLRRIYDALGGDPKRRGRKPTKNPQALEELVHEFPAPKKLQEALVAEQTSATDAQTQSQSKEIVDKAKLEAATQKFIRTMETASETSSPRKIAAGAVAEIKALLARLSDKKTREGMSIPDQADVRKAVEKMQEMLAECKAKLK